MQPIINAEKAKNYIPRKLRCKCQGVELYNEIHGDLVGVTEQGVTHTITNCGVTKTAFVK